MYNEELLGEVLAVFLFLVLPLIIIGVIIYAK